MQIFVDTHSHTLASTHAYSTLGEYVAEAKRKGMQMFSLTEHGPDMPDSPHPWHFGNRKVIPRIIDGIAILKGIEANIREPSGGLDIPEGMLSYLDFAIASFHEPVFTPGSKKEHTRAIINSMKTGHCQILGHLGNPNYPFHHDEVIKAAKDLNVLVEINNSSLTHSRAGSEKNCKAIMECIDKHDWKVVFSSDAHIAHHLGEFTESIEIAKQIGFPESCIVNKHAERFLRFLGEHGKSVAVELADWSASHR